MTLRVKSDKEYAALLLNMTQQTEKQEAADYISTVSKVRAVDAAGTTEIIILAIFVDKLLIYTED